MHESEVTVVPVVSAEAHQTNCATQTSCEAVGAVVGLDDLIDEVKVFGAPHAQPVDGLLVGRGILVGGRHHGIVAIHAQGQEGLNWNSMPLSGGSDMTASTTNPSWTLRP